MRRPQPEEEKPFKNKDSSGVLPPQSSLVLVIEQTIPYSFLLSFHEPFHISIMARLAYAAIALSLAVSSMAAPLNPVNDNILARDELTTHHYRADIEPEMEARSGGFLGLREDEEELLTREDVESDLEARKLPGFLGKALGFLGFREDEEELLTREDVEAELEARKLPGFLGKALGFLGFREDSEEVTREDLEEAMEVLAREDMAEMPLESRWWTEENDNYAREDTDDFWDMVSRSFEDLD